MTTLIACAGVDMGYGRRVVLPAVSLAVQQGEILGILGPNGAGKTTLIKTLLGLQPPVSGAVHYPTGRHAVRFGFAAQRQLVDETYPVTAREVVMMGRYGLLRPGRQPKQADHCAVVSALARVGLAELADRLFRELSGGQKQRVLLARALAAEPTVLVVDEPTTDMDPGSERAIITLIARLHREEQLTILVVSHLLHVVLNLASRVALVHGGVTTVTIDDLLASDRLSVCYGVPMSIGEVGGLRVAI
jgi:ABC-type Mn2+/Zn2+ transport system ATPase subunit